MVQIRLEKRQNRQISHADIQFENFSPFMVLISEMIEMKIVLKLSQRALLKLRGNYVGGALLLMSKLRWKTWKKKWPEECLWLS